MNTITHATDANLSYNYRVLTGVLVLLCWISPFFGYGIFFPIGVLFLYTTNHKVRSAAFLSVLIQFTIYVLTYPFEIATFISEELSSLISVFLFMYYTHIKLFCYFLLAPLILLVEYVYLKKKSKNVNPFYQLYGYRQNKLTRLPYLFLILFLSFMLSEIKSMSSLNGGFFNQIVKDSSYQNTLGIFDFLRMLIERKDLGEIIKGITSESNAFYMLRSISMTGLIRDSLLDFWMIFFLIFSSFRGRGVAFIFRRAYCSLYVHHKYSGPTKEFSSFHYHNKYTFSRVRELLLPGWGHIYLNRYWFGFPILFLYLLGILFFMTFLFYYIDPSIGVNFLNSLGMKPGIRDKTFILLADNILWVILLGLTVAIIYLFSNYHIVEALSQDNEPEDERGLSAGLNNNIGLSILAHVILLSIVLLVPLNIQRSSASEKKKEVSNYQPEKLEYYFIDPEIPDEVKDLNGGVISGTETPNKEEGEKVADETPKDEGKVKGFVKRIRGKKLPKTYSNYISARMRGPESFMEYWKRAPFPYSSVVAYTITNEGDIIDVEIVESSIYPEQDALTIELIQSMSPVMPPPDTKGDVRVTELFWNGPIDPDSMPTPLQKDLVTQFDGRVMEEF